MLLGGEFLCLQLLLLLLFELLLLFLLDLLKRLHVLLAQFPIEDLLFLETPFLIFILDVKVGEGVFVGGF